MSTRLERTQQIEYLEAAFKEASGIYVTDFNGIDVEKITKFRNDLRAVNSKYIVVKNTLAGIALKNLGMENIVPYLKGPVGIAVATDDAVSPAKVIKEFRKEHKDLLPLKVAYVDGNLFDEAEANKLADLPSREVLLSQLLSCMAAPMSNFVGALNGVFTKLTGTLEAVKTKKESEEN